MRVYALSRVLSASFSFVVMMSIRELRLFLKSKDFDVKNNRFRSSFNFSRNFTCQSQSGVEGGISLQLRYRASSSSNLPPHPSSAKQFTQEARLLESLPSKPFHSGGVRTPGRLGALRCISTFEKHPKSVGPSDFLSGRLSSFHSRRFLPRKLPQRGVCTAFLSRAESRAESFADSFLGNRRSLHHTSRHCQQSCRFSSASTSSTMGENKTKDGFDYDLAGIHLVPFFLSFLRGVT